MPGRDDTANLYGRLVRLGCHLKPDGDLLRVQDPARVLTGDLREAIRACKPDLMVLLRERYEERAAIMEYDGGLSREEAERQAWEYM